MPPKPPADLTFVDVFAVNITLNTCYRIPLITYTAAGTLLAIAEERYAPRTTHTLAHPLDLPKRHTKRHPSRPN
jgi:hypothetical protein